MLSIPGRQTSASTSRFCDGRSRRDILRAGTLAVGGLTLPQLLQAEQASGIRNSKKAVIMIYMCGAPGHQDMYDLKMDAPSEIRGEFKPIATSVPGIEICEHMPRMAAIMDKCVPLRSMYGSPSGAHDSFICYTGRKVPNQPAGGWPSVGSVASKVLGPSNESVPPFVGLSPNAGHPPYGSPGHPGFLGTAHAAFRPSGPAREDMVLQGIDSSRLDSRRALLTGIDRIRRDIDDTGTLEGLDTMTQQAFDILTSSSLADAARHFEGTGIRPRTVRQRRSQKLRRRSTSKPGTLPDGSPTCGSGLSSRHAELRPLGFPQR